MKINKTGLPIFAGTGATMLLTAIFWLGLPQEVVGPLGGTGLMMLMITSAFLIIEKKHQKEWHR